jgi:kinesin family member 11
MKQVEILERSMKHLRREFEEAMALLASTDAEPAHAKEKLDGTTYELADTKTQLSAVEGVLEEMVVRQAHEETEVALHGVVTNGSKSFGNSTPLRRLGGGCPRCGGTPS